MVVLDGNVSLLYAILLACFSIISVFSVFVAFGWILSSIWAVGIFLLISLVIYSVEIFESLFMVSILLVA